MPLGVVGRCVGFTMEQDKVSVVSFSGAHHVGRRTVYPLKELKDHTGNLFEEAEDHGRA